MDLVIRPLMRWLFDRPNHSELHEDSVSSDDELVGDSVSELRVSAGADTGAHMNTGADTDADTGADTDAHTNTDARTSTPVFSLVDWDGPA